MPHAGRTRRARKLAVRSLALPFLAITSGCGGGGDSASAPPPVVLPTPTPTPAPTPTPTPTPGLAAVTTADLGRGWNLGNSLDALVTFGPYPKTSSQETYWGNPVVDQQDFDVVAAAGFKSVRIPVSWFQYADDNGNIEPFWLERVKEVVDMALNAGLYVILNQHHHNGELNPSAANQAAANAKLEKLWTQVAEYFKDYDNRLLFAGTNEIHMPNDYNAPSAENCAVQTEFNQVFVDAVRATGGNNASRMLVFQGYATNLDWSIDVCGAKVPTDTISGRLMFEIHFYTPWNFVLNDQSPLWQWGAIATDPSATDTYTDESDVDAHFARAKAMYADKGIPVILGEYCAISKTNYDPILKYRDYWVSYVTDSALRHGLATYFWDAGYYPNHSCGLFNRTTGAETASSTINAIMTAP